MKKINLYKPGGKGKDAIPKTIQEVAEELEERLKSQGLIPDSYFLSANFKGTQKDDFPVDRKVSGTLSVGRGEIRAFISLDSDEGEESQLKGRMCIAQYKIDKGKVAEAFEKAEKALKVMMGSFYIDIKENLNIQTNIENTQQAKETAEQQEPAEPIKESIAISTDNKSPQEIAKSIQQALSDSQVAEEYKKLQEQEQETDKKITTQAANIQTARTQTIKIQSGNNALVDEKIVKYSNNKASKESAQTA